LLDTNVISEPMRPQPSVAVIRWLETQNPGSLFLSAVTLGELVAGIRRLTSTARRRALEQWLLDVVAPQFQGRILAFDSDAAWRWGGFVADSETAGRPRPAIDLQIAAIAAHHDLVLVTRNAKDFEGLGVDVLNPWSSRG
jgi:predicted nucleic acid-binding protein